MTTQLYQPARRVRRYAAHARVEPVGKVILCYNDAIKTLYGIIKTPHPREAHGEIQDYDYSQGKFIPISFDKQILHGTFEHTLHYLIDNDLDLSAFDLQYKNDETGAPAYDPRILLKIVLYAYSKGITSSRKIADCCNDNVIFMALSADTRPHFTTIADFISSHDQETM